MTGLVGCAGGMGKEGIALVPVLDMLDHSPAVHVAWHTGPTGTDDFQFITHTATEQATPPPLLRHGAAFH